MSIQQLSALYEDVVEQVINSLRGDDTLSIRKELDRYYPSELALILEALPHGDRTEVWALLSAQT